MITLQQSLSPNPPTQEFVVSTVSINGANVFSTPTAAITVLDSLAPQVKVTKMAVDVGVAMDTLDVDSVHQQVRNNTTSKKLHRAMHTTLKRSIPP